MFKATELIADAVSSRLRGADVSVDWDAKGYVLSVKSDQFHAVRKVDRETMVYDTLQRLPLSILSKIHTIETEVAHL